MLVTAGRVTRVQWAHHDGTIAEEKVPSEQRAALCKHIVNSDGHTESEKDLLNERIMHNDRTAYVCKIAIRRSRKNHALYSVVDTEGTVTHNIPMHKIEDCIRQNQSRKTTKAHRLPRRQVWEVTQYHCDGQIDNARTALKDYAMHGRRPYTRDPLRISRDTND